jgi:hypothetical protein
MARSERIKPQRSIQKGVGPKDNRPFSSFDDLAEWAVKRGWAKDVAEIRSKKPLLWGDLLFAWYTQGQIACVFAQNLARDPGKAGWYSAVVREGLWNADHITGIVDGVAAVGAEALQLLFPGEGSVEQALQITKTLGVSRRWSCVDIGWLDGESGDSLQIGLRWVAPSRTYESWALGIAPFEPMPFTRRFRGAPFIALILRPTPPMENRAPIPTGQSGLPASHLAHMDDGLATNTETREKWTHGTRQAKRALISPDPMSRARAKVTFSFPPWAKQELVGVLQNAEGTSP